MRYARGAVACLLWLLTIPTAGSAHAEHSPPRPDPLVGLADSAALRATVFGPRPQDLAPMPERVPLQEFDIALPWARPVPEVFWFDRRLRGWLAAQDHPAPLAIVIAGTGGNGNDSRVAILRGALYGAGYHVLSIPSPTFPGFIVSASSTGVAGDLLQDGRDLYASIVQILLHLPKTIRITDVDVLGYSLGGANAAILKSIDATAGQLRIHRAVMINPPVSLLASMSRLDQLFALSIGSGDSGQAGFERLYRRLYARLANLYRNASPAVIAAGDLLSVARAVLTSDADLAASIALSFRISLTNMFYAGDLYAGTRVVVDPGHPPRVGDSMDETQRILRGKPFSEYFSRVFVPYYLAHRSGSTVASLRADNRLDIIGSTLRSNSDYYAQTNSDDPILDQDELTWLRATMGPRIVVYDHGGHLGNLGERRQIADLIEMLSGRWQPRQ